jgi:hypothetical protein
VHIEFNLRGTRFGSYRVHIKASVLHTHTNNIIHGAISECGDIGHRGEGHRAILYIDVHLYLKFPMFSI